MNIVRVDKFAGKERNNLGEGHTGVPPLEIDLFGPISIRVGGRELPPLPSRKGLYLLALLVLRHDRAVERDYLAGLLWPESAQEKALFNLRQALVPLRQALGPEARRLSAPSRHTLRLEVSDATIDLVTFDTAMMAHKEPAAYQRAVALYRGPLLEGCDEEWVFPPRRAREQALLDALEFLAQQAMQQHDFAAAIGSLRQMLRYDPLREGAYRRLMEAYAANGEYAEATQLYRDLRLLLHNELNASVAPETAELYRNIREKSQDISRRPPPSALPDRPAPQARRETPPLWEAAGGAVSLDSPFYIPRPADARLEAAITGRHSVALVKGTRQTGKTSLLVRGLEAARASGAVVTYTNANALDAAVLGSREALYRTLMGELADQLDLHVAPEEVWNESRAANTNLDRYLRREILGSLGRPLVWVLDEVDRLFACEFRNEVFALFRSWHDRRAMDPTGAWSRLTLVLSYATEAHLFITDLNQSPFNVGTRLTVEDFTLPQVADLNARYGHPLKEQAQVARFHALVGGHPYLVRRGLEVMVADGLTINAVEAQADREDGLYGGHLHLLYRTLTRDTDLTEMVRGILRGTAQPSDIGYYRLFSAGILAGSADRKFHLRCPVYTRYLTRCLL